MSSGNTHLRGKRYAESVMAPAYPLVSRRLLSDLADRAAHEFDDEVDDHQVGAQALVESRFRELLPLSAPLSRHITSDDFNHALEIILLVRDSSVGPGTSIERLARLLKHGIERSDDRYRVRIGRVERPGARLADTVDEICVLALYQQGTRHDIQPIVNAVEESVAPLMQRAAVPASHDPPRRVVYVTANAAPQRAQAAAAALLPELLIWNGEAQMCSLIPTIIRPATRQGTGEFNTEPLYERTHLRFHRDKTILAASARHDNELPQEPPINEIDRWTRNVMNKQVGVASSGGGACAYRLIALLRKLHEDNIPVDVFGGLSGGAVIGAYYAAEGLDGLTRVLDRGETFAALLPRLFFSTRHLQRVIDEDLGTRRVGGTSVKFYSVTTRMGDGRTASPPHGSVVTQGTLGQAARVASALPIGFAPTSINGCRYTDGMASTIVPTHVLIDHGADIVLACNCVPPPKNSNPFIGYRLGRALYNCTPAGRVIDAWSWIDHLADTASIAEGFGSTTYFQFNPANQANMEMLRWADAYRILDSALAEKDKIRRATDRVKAVYNSMPWSQI